MNEKEFMDAMINLLKSDQELFILLGDTAIRVVGTMTYHAAIAAEANTKEEFLDAVKEMIEADQEMINLTEKYIDPNANTGRLTVTESIKLGRENAGYHSLHKTMKRLGVEL